MTPKEKAEELIDAYYNHSDLLFEALSFIQAKECALIAVDEIIKQNVSSPIDYGLSWTYWMQVKKEIEKL